MIPDDGVWSEPDMNGFPESETAERFATVDYQVLIVAEIPDRLRPATLFRRILALRREGALESTPGQ